MSIQERNDIILNKFLGGNPIPTWLLHRRYVMEKEKIRKENTDDIRWLVDLPGDSAGAGVNVQNLFYG